MSYLVYSAWLLMAACGVFLTVYFLWRIYLFIFIVARPTASGWQVNSPNLLAKDIQDLAKRARKYLYVVCRGTPELWGRRQVQKALRRASTGRREVNVEFVVGEGFDDTEDHPLVHLENEGVITLHRLSHELARHFAIADGKHYTLAWPDESEIRFVNVIRDNESGGQVVLEEYRGLVSS